MSKNIRSVWEIVTRIPKDDGSMVRCSMMVVADNIEQVWDYIAADLADEKTEVEAIGKIGPIVATLPERSEAKSG